MKRKFLVLVTLLLVLVLSMAFIACTDYEREEEPEEETKETITYNQLIKNGTFYDAVSSSKNGIYDSVTSWSAKAAGLAVPTNGSDEANGVFAAVIDLTGDKISSVLENYVIQYDEVNTEERLGEAKAFTNKGVDTNSPKGKKTEEGEVLADQYQDTNALLLASVNTSGSIYFKSDDITLDANSVYELQFSVCSLVENEESGAFVNITGGIDKSYRSIKTNNEWETSTLYIESNANSAMTINIELWLGYGPVKSQKDDYKDDGNDKLATRGFALFDNVILTKLVEKDADGETEKLFSSVYEGYNKDISLHENFLAFNDENKYSAYYIKGADMANRTHIDTVSYFGDSSTYRKYFYELRDYHQDNLATTYWTKASDFSASTGYYGVINTAKIYNGKKDSKGKYIANYSVTGMKDKFMEYDDWSQKVMTETYKNAIAYGDAEKEEAYALMVYNDSLGASGFVTGSTNTLTIKKNSYYKISVDAYVWNKLFEGDGVLHNGLFDSYDKTTGHVDKPKAVTDPTTAKNVSAYLYNIKQNADSDLSLLDYFTKLTDYDKDFDVKNIINKKDDGELYIASIDKMEGYGTATTGVLKAVYDWIYEFIKDVENEDGTKVYTSLTDSEKETLAKSFLYAYLYYSYAGIKTGEGESESLVIATPAYVVGEKTAKASLRSLLGYPETVPEDPAEDALLALLKKAYEKELMTNFDLLTTIEGKKKTYDETDKPKYEDELAKYNAAKRQYEADCEAWYVANGNMPHATFRLTGAGSDIEVKTTTKDAWETIVLYVRGNQLSDRKVTLNLLFGEKDSVVSKMIGGVIFDNLTIEEIASGDVPGTAKLHTLSDIDNLTQVQFGDLVHDNEALSDAQKREIADKWVVRAAKGTAEENNPEDAIAVEVVADSDLQKVLTNYTSYKLQYEHTKETASSIRYEGEHLAEIKPLKYYRFAFQVKTKDVTGGASIVLLTKKADGEFTEFNTSVTASSEEWKEVVYYIQGANTETYYLSIEVDMGSGDRFNTDSYVKGTTWLASFNCLEISKDEYDSAATGDILAKGSNEKAQLALETKSYAIDGSDNNLKFTNSSYSSIDYDKLSADELENGLLKDDAIIPITDWTKGNVHGNNFETPSISWAVNTDSEKIIQWKKVVAHPDATESGIDGIPAKKFEIWVKYKEDGKDINVLVGVYDLSGLSDADYENEYGADGYLKREVTGFVNGLSVDCTVYIKAVSEDGVSENSNELTVAKLNNEGGKPVKADVEPIALKYGARKVNEGDFAGSSYSTAYDYLYTIHSNYYVAASVASSKLSLNANGYYKISVWVKTTGDAFGGVILTGTNGSAEAVLTKDGSIGYNNIKTDPAVNGGWEEYTIYLKTGNFSVTPTVNFCLGNPYASSKSLPDADNKSYYDKAELSIGSVYFDVVRVQSITEDDYLMAEGVIADGENGVGVLDASEKLLYKGATTYVYSMKYTIDSFDTWSTTSTEKFGHTPINYTTNQGDGFSKESTGENYVYGIYNPNSADESMIEALKYLYSNGTEEEKMLFNKYFGFDSNMDWDAYLKAFLKLEAENGKSGGENVLVMSNKIATGFPQIMEMSDTTYNVTVAQKGYYKLTFTAATLLARPVAKEVSVSPEDQADWSNKKGNYYVKSKSGSGYTPATDSYNNETKYYQFDYVYDDCYAELRYKSGESNVDPLTMYISSYDADAEFYGSLNEHTYTIYIYNEGSNKTASWSFYLGDATKKDDDGMYNGLLVGMLAVDLVSMDVITEEEYNAGIEGIADNYNEDGEIIDGKSRVLKYVYAAEKTDEKDTDDGDTDEGDTKEEQEKEDFWTRLVKDQYFWLYISSFVLGIIIIIVVIVVLVRKFKEKHPRKVVGENMVKTEKDIKVVEPEAQEKEEALEFDEYVDEIKPVVQQRVLPKKKKKKKK